MPEAQGRTAASFEAARADFEEAWREYLPTRTEADFQEWGTMLPARGLGAPLSASTC